MKFIDCEDPLTVEEITAFERQLGLRFPQSLRKHFLRANGGSPDPCVYDGDNVGVVVQECLPLRHGKGSAIKAYETLVLAKELVPEHFFPFAVDPGGDYLYVDCSSASGAVYLYLHDTGSDHLVSLNVSLDDFWSRLKRES
jgi:cell wall assembly regulator SMI1